MTQVVACIDGSYSDNAVSDSAVWIGKRLDKSLLLLHLLDEKNYPSTIDYSGSIGLDCQKAMLDQLAKLDIQRKKIALEHGRFALNSAKERVESGGASAESCQRHNDLLTGLSEFDSKTTLIVMGRRGQDTTDQQHIGSQLESVIRMMHKPIWVSGSNFVVPTSYLLAFDGSQTAVKIAQWLAESSLLKGLDCHLLVVADKTDEIDLQLLNAKTALQRSAKEVHVVVRSGDVTEQVCKYQAEQAIDLLVMGAYGHSRIRQFFVGSTTQKILVKTKTSLLVLR